MEACWHSFCNAQFLMSLPFPFNKRIINLMNGLRKKVSKKCECGKTVSKGSVFCPHCRAMINRKNVKTMKKEERSYLKNMRSSRLGRKK